MASRLAGLRETQVLGPFGSLLGAQVIGSGLGFVFWVVAARVLTTDTVGVSSAVISTHTFVGTIAMLGLGTLLLGELKGRPAHRQRHLLSTALAVAGVAGAVLGVGVVLAAPLLSHTLRVAFADDVVAVTFVAGAGATAAGLVLDQSVLGLERSRLQVWRNLIASGLRFPLAGLLLLAGLRSPVVVVVSWVVAVVVSVAVVWPVLRLPRRRRTAEERPLRQVRAYWRPALHNHALNQSLAAGPMLVPVVAAMVLRPVANGEFAVAWLLATFVFLPPYMLATALFAVNVDKTVPEFRAAARRTLPAALTLSALLCVGTWLVGPLVLRIFGADYADNSATTLNLLVAGGLWMVVKDHLVTYARVTDRLLLAASWALAGVVLELVGALVGGGVAGAEGLAVGWLLVLAVEAAGGTWLARRLLAEPDVPEQSEEKR